MGHSEHSCFWKKKRNEYRQFSGWEIPGTNLDYVDPWGLAQIVRIIENPDNQKYKINITDL